MRITEITYISLNKHSDAYSALDTKSAAHIISQIRRFADSLSGKSAQYKFPNTISFLKKCPLHFVRNYTATNFQGFLYLNLQEE